MEYKALFDQIVYEGFSIGTALSAIQILTLNNSVKPNMKDLKITGHFHERIKGKAKNLLWDLPKEDFELAFKVYECLPDFSMCQNLAGLGGCVKRTIREIMEKK